MIDSDDAPAGLEPDTFAARLYDMLGPLAQADPDNGWSLLTYANAVGTMFQLVEDLVRDTSDGPGWSSLLDLDRCPPVALPWLAQFVGVRLQPADTDAASRARIAAVGGFKRGTLAAMVAACQATLTGARTVWVSERSGDKAVEPIAYAYRLAIRTYVSQTPDVAATRAALVAQKPGGIVLDYAAISGQTWQQVKNTNASWQAVKTKYPDWFAVKSDEP